MSNQSKSSKPALVPLDIARETFKQMALRRVVPSPDNYLLIYNEIAGITVKETAESAIRKALKQLPNETTEQSKWINRWDKLLKQENWADLPILLNDSMDANVAVSKQWPDAIRELIQNWDAKQVGLDVARKKEALEKVLINFGSDPLLAQKLQALANNWKAYGVSDASASKTIEVIEQAEVKPLNLSDAVLGDAVLESQALVAPTLNTPSLKLPETLNPGYEPDQFQETFRALQDMLKQSLNHGLIPRLDGYPELKEEAEQIFALSEKARKLKDWQAVVKQFRALLVRVEIIGANEEGIKQDLLNLLKLLIDNIGELVADDQWVRGQVTSVQTIISGTLDRALIVDAERSLKEVIFKQGMLKHSLADAKNAFKSMIATFVDRLSHMTNSTDTYQSKVGQYADKLAETEDIAQINILLEGLMKDTHTMQTDIVRSRDSMMQQTAEVEVAQQKIQQLQAELSQLSEKVSIDQLTGVLNRRGLDEAMLREISRAQRGASSLCVALLDIDNFKHFNDNYGHNVGDTALQHLAKVIQETLRPTDIAARFGGEEFVILLPDTTIDAAVETISRLQRALTKQFFLGNNERLLITFSAGIALFRETEEQATILNRADQAMYLAKKSGKNRVMTEVDLEYSSQKLAPT
ncbi:GGDEF domain-containing protein [Methylotenera versatilis]|uniref:diguanylate cyclase n=1 Tax=Methylotenera versatilis (strain 301) TaxID=666681 RepID=D7DPX4_METV0|nr:GGDEF domain-containing protein [Methylotenera versatilis]ADI29345.1 diguanylate cyclase [Methylotenera versatilis 301]